MFTVENWPVGFTCNTSAQCRSLFPGSHCAYNGCICIKGHYYDWKKIACVPRTALLPSGIPGSTRIPCRVLIITIDIPDRKQTPPLALGTPVRNLDSFIEFPVEEPSFVTVIIKGLGIIILKSGWTVHSQASANEIIRSRRAMDSGPLASAANRKLFVFPGTAKKSVHVSSKYSSRELLIRLLPKR
ncbi:unnamed protein product, partial [Ixodes hexagonus]